MNLEKLFGSVRRMIDSSHEDSRRLLSANVDHTLECARRGNVSTLVSIVVVVGKRFERFRYQCDECFKETISDFPSGPERIF